MDFIADWLCGDANPIQATVPHEIVIIIYNQHVNLKATPLQCDALILSSAY